MKRVWKLEIQRTTVETGYAIAETAEAASKNMLDQYSTRVVDPRLGRDVIINVEESAWEDIG